MKALIPFLSLAFLCLLSCNKPSYNLEVSAIETDFQSLLNKVVDERRIHGSVIFIEAPQLGLSWEGFAGYADKVKTDTLVSQQPFRIASVTKTFTATAILRLMEEGKLSLEDPISKYISTEHLNILKSGGYKPDQITIRHCLNHTSGLFDYAMDDNTTIYIDKVKANPAHRWTRTEQLQGAMDWGQAYGLPGEKYTYGDTGYILLGEIIEILTGESLGMAMRNLIGYEQLGMNRTWLESIEPAPENLPDRIHNYFHGVDYYDADPSADLYGGGGLVSTVSDLSSFFHGLFNGKIYKKAGTLSTMLTKTEVQDLSSLVQDYRMGLWLDTVYGMEVYRHSGLWGTHIFHLPSINATIAINNTDRERAFLEKQAIWMLKEMHQQKSN